MKRTKNRSEVSLFTIKSEIQCTEELSVPPLDILSIKVIGLRVPDEYSKPYSLKISFIDKLLLSNVINSSNYKESEEKRIIAKAYMNYDPSDYTKMSYFADSPLTVRIHPFKSNLSSALNSTAQSQSIKSSAHNEIDPIQPDGYYCNMDILPILMGTKKLILKQRMEPVVPPSILLANSWDNLPEIHLCIESIKNKKNLKHQNNIKEANFMEITIVGCYNTIVPYDDKCVYIVASKLPLQNDTHTEFFTFSRGYRLPEGFSHLSFYPHWESLRLSNDPFSKGNKKMQINAIEVQNEHNIDFNYYFNKLENTVIWASFHRTLFLKSTEEWLYKHLHRYQWPIEINIIGENHAYSFMAFLDLFKLLYPGEKTVHLVVPLQWVDKNSMMTKCGCESLLSNNAKSSNIVQNTSKPTTELAPTASATGADGRCAFVIVEVTLGTPFMQPVIPPHISESDVSKMLEEIETQLIKRKCTGRGQLEYNWQATVQNAVNSLQRVPYYGFPDLCSFNGQMRGSRVRVELMTSFWQEAAVYVNNNFVVNDFLHSDDTFEEMTMIAHACLMRMTTNTLTDVDSEQANSTLQAARHARQLQDLPHAVQLYLQLIVEGPREANSWRELATCLKDLDKEWANACINKSIMLHTRHPLSLLSKGCMVFEEDPDAAEPFFVALLALYPFWVSMCVCVSAYYLQRELFDMAKAIIEQVRKTQAEGLSDDIRYPRAWERELGDWWDNTPLLPGTNLYYDAADLLLRIRAISLAEVCVARALTETGECPVYYHLVALCCRLRGKIEDALCHLQQGIKKFGEISYLRILQGECYHKLRDLSASTESLKKAKNCGSYIALLSFPRKDNQRTQPIISDVVRRYPSAYSWMTFADYWMMRSLTSEGDDSEATEEQKTARASAISCLFKALKYDRRIGRAWKLLASLVKPGERRQYCKEMAAMCDYNKPSEDRLKHSFENKESLYHLGKAIRECCFEMCKNLYL